jgi:hypothetical protein
MAIISILAALLLPAVHRAYQRVKGFQDDFEGETITAMLTAASGAYCAAHPKFHFDDKSDFATKCRLAPKCVAWVTAAKTEFVPFDYLTVTNRVVLTVHSGRDDATARTFTKADLSAAPK